MALTPHDPHNAREMAAVIALGLRIERRRAYGKPTKALERQVERIREQAQAREDARGRKK
ncbi:hypothetical protein AB0I54_31755 [Streptomyces sp. NPDC050625]|uniref:hypothetical protein n=1 Tax=Streptomyces sp. NPDC050625 TaxID=3154629 RepID=UPI00341BAA99